MEKDIGKGKESTSFFQGTELSQAVTQYNAVL